MQGIEVIEAIRAIVHLGETPEQRSHGYVGFLSRLRSVNYFKECNHCVAKEGIPNSVVFR